MPSTHQKGSLLKDGGLDEERLKPVTATWKALYKDGCDD